MGLFAGQIVCERIIRAQTANKTCLLKGHRHKNTAHASLATVTFKITIMTWDVIFL